MSILEIRDPAEARQFLTQGLCLQRLAAPSPAVLDWSLALAAEGSPLPPPGFVADVGHLLLQAASSVVAPPPFTGWPAALMRRYDDHVLGKLLADSSIERAQDALRSYQGRDWVQGLAFVLRQMQERAGFVGVHISPATLKSLRDVEAEAVLAEGWGSMQDVGPMPLLIELYEALIASLRSTPRVLGREDLFELERRTAIAAFGQRIALRQVLHAAQVFDEALPHRPPRSPGRRYEVPTRILEEDAYPIGGFSSISTRGTIESLLHSQLAYMEGKDRPDLFDIKFLRDELLYYARDENSFLRRRRTFILALYPDLVQARFKDAELPYQRIILLLALVQTLIGRLIDWLNADALRFELLLVEGASLDAERELLEILLADQIANGTVSIESIPAAALAGRCVQHSRRSLCHCLLTSVQEQQLHAEHAIVSRLVLDRAAPSLGVADEPAARFEGHDALQGWTMLLERLLEQWI